MRKLCTRQHFIEYLSYNFVERQCLLARCLFERSKNDFGFDGEITTFNKKGEMELGELKIQIKSTEKAKYQKRENTIAFDLSKRDLELWLDTLLPVVCVLYDAKTDIG